MQKQLMFSERIDHRGPRVFSGAAVCVGSNRKHTLFPAKTSEVCHVHTASGGNKETKLEIWSEGLITYCLFILKLFYMCRRSGLKAVSEEEKLLLLKVQIESPVFTNAGTKTVSNHAC